MRATRRELAGMIGGAAVASALATPAYAKPPPPCPLATPLDMIADTLLAQMPEAATNAGVAQAQDGGPLARRMDDYSPAGEAARRSALRAAEAELAGISCAGDPGGVLHLDIARAVIANATRAAGVPYGRIDTFGFSGHAPYLVTPTAGPHVDSIAIMTTQQSLASPAAVDAWIEKLDGFATAFAGVIETLRADEAAGCRTPRVLLEKSRPVIAAFLAGPAEAHPLIVALRERMAAAALDPRLRAAAEARAITALEKRARPAFAALGDEIAAMAPRGREDAGLWAQPEGEALYAANVRALGDTALDPAAIHALGLAQIQRIKAAMDRLLRQRGLSQGSVGARMAALAQQPANIYPDTAAGHARLLETVTERVRAMEARYADIVPDALIPRQPLDVRRLPIAAEQGAPGGFYDGPTLDGARPGTLWINMRDMRDVPGFRLPTLAYHEGVPGHHLQGSIALALTDRPLLVRLARFNAYQEGWALYAERLAAEMGAYAHDPLGNLGRLQDDLFRAARLVVDTGLHHERWSRERAIAWLRDTTGIAEGRVTAEVERYMAWPGQALGYKLGALRLLGLRQRWRRAKGKRYSRKAFHALVLGSGAMPLDLVERLLFGE